MLDVAGKVSTYNRANRFKAVLGEPTYDASFCEPSDTVIFADAEFVVCPTLGSFLPYWYLLIPRDAHLNFADWSTEHPNRCVSSEIKRIFLNKLGDDSKYIWFEHGPATTGSITGCGVDHAHLHILMNSAVSIDDILMGAAEFGVDNWQEVDVDQIYTRRNECDEYLAFGNGARGFLKNLKSAAGTQFFRRVLAHLSGYGEVWDYKSHPYQENAQLSVNRFAPEAVSG